MDTTTHADATAPALSGTQAWLVGISLAAVALGSLATALTLQGPAHDAAAAEPREIIVSTQGPAPQPARTAPRSAPGRTSPGADTKPRSLAEAKRL